MAEYIDKKQAIDRIASCYCINCEHSNGILCRACEHQDDMDLIDDMPAADVQPISQWISVKDRLPENCIEVLVYDTDCGIVIGWHDKEIGDFAADFISPLDAVTHWMPLPEPPQD